MAEDIPPDAAQRKLQRLHMEALGAQHESPAAKALEQFNRDLTADYAAANAQAEAEELSAIPAEDETEAEVDAEDGDDHHSRSRSRKRR